MTFHASRADIISLALSQRLVNDTKSEVFANPKYILFWKVSFCQFSVFRYIDIKLNAYKFIEKNCPL